MLFIPNQDLILPHLSSTSLLPPSSPPTLSHSSNWNISPVSQKFSISQHLINNCDMFPHTFCSLAPSLPPPSSQSNSLIAAGSNSPPSLLSLFLRDWSPTCGTNILSPPSFFLPSFLSLFLQWAEYVIDHSYIDVLLEYFHRFSGWITIWIYSETISNLSRSKFSDQFFYSSVLHSFSIKFTITTSSSLFPPSFFNIETQYLPPYTLSLHSSLFFCMSSLCCLHREPYQILR